MNQATKNNSEQGLFPRESAPVTSSNINCAGFRLHDLEIFNWGTFHGKVWKMSPMGTTSLLCGANGSGKSTLVDALLTLLVPSVKRNYNVASGLERKRERNEKSYMLGVYGKKRDVELQISKVEYLRTKDDYAVIVGYFYNADVDKHVTLAQVFYFQNDIFRKIHIVSELQLGIKEHFSRFANIPLLKKQIKSLPGTEIIDHFSEYSLKFRKAMGIRSEKALDLFNQTIAIKEIGQLNEFIRKHMLEKTDTLERMNTLRANFNNLDKAHQAIIKAKLQLDHLNPLVKALERLDKIVDQIKNFKHMTNMIPIFFARLKTDFIEKNRREKQIVLDQIHNQLKRVRADLKNLRQEEIDLMTAIDKNKHGQHIKELREHIHQLTKDAERKKHQAERYNELAQKLASPINPSETQFYSIRDKTARQQEGNTIKRNELIARRDELKITQTQLNTTIEGLQEELQSLLVPCFKSFAFKFGNVKI